MAAARSLASSLISALWKSNKFSLFPTCYISPILHNRIKRKWKTAAQVCKCYHTRAHAVRDAVRNLYKKKRAPLDHTKSLKESRSCLSTSTLFSHDSWSSLCQTLNLKGSLEKIWRCLDGKSSNAGKRSPRRLSRERSSCLLLLSKRESTFESSRFSDVYGTAKIEISQPEESVDATGWRLNFIFGSFRIVSIACVRLTATRAINSHSDRDQWRRGDLTIFHVLIMKHKSDCST